MRGRYAERDHYALVVEVRGGGRVIRCTLSGRQQAEATAVGVGAITEALWTREVHAPGVWLAEQIIAPQPFFTRLAAHGIVPTIEEVSASRPASAAARGVAATRLSAASLTSETGALGLQSECRRELAGGPIAAGSHVPS